MIKVSERALKFIKENIENADNLLKGETVENFNKLLSDISDIMIYKGFEKDGDINDFGRSAERAYDDICYNGELYSGGVKVEME